jgi:hypothetical protein
MLLDRAGLESGSLVRETVSNEIELRQRMLKEDLFKQGSVRVNLAGGTYQASLSQEELMASPQMQSFQKDLEAAFDETLERADAQLRERYLGSGLLVVLTGGSANLPLVKALASGRSMKHGCLRVAAPLLPTGVPQDVEPEYLQLAVAWGGAMPGLPEIGKTFTPITPSKTNWSRVRFRGFADR